jgi:hypothetical protein
VQEEEEERLKDPKNLSALERATLRADKHSALARSARANARDERDRLVVPGPPDEEEAERKVAGPLVRPYDRTTRAVLLLASSRRPRVR